MEYLVRKLSDCGDLQIQNAVAAYSKSEQLLPFGFAPRAVGG